MLLIGLTIFFATLASLVAFFTLLRNTSSRVHRWLFLLIVSSCAWVLTVNLHSVVSPDIGLWLLRFAFLAATFLGFAMLQFVWALCGIAPKVYSKLAWLIMLFGCVASLSPWVTKGFIGYTPSGAIQPARGFVYPLALAVILYFVAHALVVLERQRRLQKGSRRTQFSIVGMGLLLGTLVGVVTNIILPNLTQTTYPSRFAFLAIIILTVSLVYAVVQHRFLDVRLAVARTGAYALALVVVALLYVLSVFALTQVLISDLPLDHPLQQTLNILAAIVVAVGFHPLKLFFDKLTSKLFFRDAYDTKEVLDAFSEILVHEVKVTPLLRRTLNTVNSAIKANYWEAAILNRKDSKVQRKVAGGSGGDTDMLIKALQKSTHKLIAVDDLQEHSNLQQLLIDANIAVAIRLETPKEQVGYLLFGYKSSGSAYNTQDVDLLRIAADELAVAIQNTLRFEEILRFNETLKQEVADATAQLRESNEKLHKLDEAKDEFISMASHQLRTPLTSVKGYLSMVLEGDAGELPKQQRKLLEEAFTSAQRMVYLIGDFLNVSRLQTGKFTLEPKPINLAEIVSHEIGQLGTTAERRNIKVEYHEPSHFPTLHLDDNKIRQVIMNFIDNSIFYSRPGGKVKVELLATGQEARLTVHDNGIGVPEVDKHKLFGKFFRAANARKVRPDGTGIGLFMAKKVVAAHGGSIIFDSQEGKGSTFGFRLPLSLKDQPNKLEDNIPNA